MIELFIAEVGVEQMTTALAENGPLAGGAIAAAWTLFTWVVNRIDRIFEKAEKTAQGHVDRVCGEVSKINTQLSKMDLKLEDICNKYDNLEEMHVRLESRVDRCETEHEIERRVQNHRS